MPGTNLSWAVGPWGACLTGCIETRAVACLDDQGVTQMDTVCEEGLTKPNSTQHCTSCGGGGMSTGTIAAIAGAAAGALLAVALGVSAWLLLRRRPRPALVAPAGGEGATSKPSPAAAAAGAAGEAGKSPRSVKASPFSWPTLVDPGTGLPLDPTRADLAGATSATADGGAPQLPPVVVHLPDARLRGEDTGTPTGRRSLRQRSPTRRAHGQVHGPSHLQPPGEGLPPLEHRVYIADSRGSTPRNQL